MPSVPGLSGRKISLSAISIAASLSYVATAIGLAAWASLRFPPQTQSAIGATLLAAAVLPLAWLAGVKARHLKDALTALCVALALFACYVLAAENAPLGIAALVGLLLAAWIEEVVFRALLPHLVSARLRNVLHPTLACVVAVVLSQAVFSACHFIPDASRFGTNLAEDALRLFVGGIFYWVIVDTAGLGIAAALHASLNLSIVTRTLDWEVLSAPELSGLIVVSFVALWARSVGAASLVVNRANLSPICRSSAPWKSSPSVSAHVVE